MRATTTLFTINGKPILAPDKGVSVSYADLEATDSGRDESGVMHRIVLRHKVPTWRISYSSLTEEERQYMEALFPDAATFTFRHPSINDASVAEETVCYRSGFNIAWQNAITGAWSGYSFDIKQC